MEDNNKKLLETIFKKHLKFFDNEMIINLLVSYKNKIPISNSDLYEQINNDKYKLSTELKEDFEKYDSSYYLFNVCLLGNESMVKYLVEHGADINYENKLGVTPILNACLSKNLHFVEYLVSLRADINKGSIDGLTPLFNACYNGNENIVKYLVKHGTYINKKDKNDVTPLFSACLSGNENLVKYLVEHGADINKENKDDKTPLFFF